MFSYARNVNIDRSTFTDVQGDFNYTHRITVQGNLSIGNDSEDARTSAMCNATSSGAAYDSEERVPPPRCYPGTRLELLSRIMDLTDGAHGPKSRIIWLHGPAGSGKSAVAQTVAEKCADLGYLAASFFFSRDRKGRDSIEHLFPTIAYQLAISIPALRPFILSNFSEDPSVIGKSAEKQIQRLIVEPFQKFLLRAQNEASTSTSKTPYLVVIDGLDDCTGDTKQSHILDHITQLIHRHSLPLQFLVASRPEAHITDVFEKVENQALVTSISLYNTHDSGRDVRVYLEGQFNQVRSSPSHKETFSTVQGHWPSRDDVDLLVGRSNGYFIYASTLIAYVDDVHFSPVQRLKEVLNTPVSGAGPFRELDNLYTQVLSACKNPELLTRILGFVLVRSHWWDAEGPQGRLVTEALQLEPDQLSITMRGLRSILVYDPLGDKYSAIHTSLHDFVFDAERSGIFHVDQQKNHEMLSRAYFRCLKTWYSTRTPSEFSLTTRMNFLFHFCKALPRPRDITCELMSTDIHFWDFHTRNTRKFDTILTAPEDAAVDWFSAVIFAFRALDPPPRALIKHFRHLWLIAVRWKVAWSSAFGTPEARYNNILSRGQGLGFLKRSNGHGSASWIHRFPGYLFGARRGIKSIHAGVAKHCFYILGLQPSELRELYQWKQQYIYARLFWAGHVARASQDDAEILYELRLVERRFLFQTDFILEAESEEEEPPPDFLGDPSRLIIHILDAFDSRGWHGPIDLWVF